MFAGLAACPRPFRLHLDAFYDRFAGRKPVKHRRGVVTDPKAPAEGNKITLAQAFATAVARGQLAETGPGRY
jgi:hypothetical protein